MKYIRKHIINEGFYNPFENTVTDDLSSTPNSPIVDDSMFTNKEDRRVEIGGVKLWNANTSNKTVYDSTRDRMYAGKFFCKGDIVEVSPVKILEDKDMYSKNIRESSFTVDKGKGLYALPLGYALCYRNSMQLPKNTGGNLKYDFDTDKNTITFTATRNIRKGEELVIEATEEDFANEIQPGQFQYPQGADPIYSTSSIKIV